MLQIPVAPAGTIRVLTTAITPKNFFMLFLYSHTRSPPVTPGNH